MASGIAHEFNNSLTPILGFSELLLDQPQILEQKARVPRYLELIHTAAADVAQVVGRVQEFYRYREESEAMVATDLNRLIDGVVEATKPRWKDMAQTGAGDVDLRTALDDDLPLIAGSETALRSALTNLILNAVDAMPHGGTLTISTGVESNNVVLRVKDTGVGMTEEVRRRAVEPFFTTKEAGGSGLGLAMVHGIVQRHKGQIYVQSEVNQGATFVIALPTATEDVFIEPAPEELELVQGRHILLVDDEADVRALVTEYLALDGNTVETAASGTEGIEKFRAGIFDLVITDRSMPAMNGDRLAMAVKESVPGTPVVMLTGFGDLMEAAGERPLGVDFIVGKPLTRADLRGALSKLFNRQTGP